MTAQRKPQGEPSKMPVKMPVPWRMYQAIVSLGLTSRSIMPPSGHPS